MSIRNLLIRIAANSIYLIRLKTLRVSDARFLVFTGTSGKTLARTASAYALHKAGFPVVSPPYGYTNELGIILAALGIESIRLLTPRGIWRVMSARPPQGAYICIELGADWRLDIPWFLKRFRPFGVYIANTSTQEWTRALENIWAEKQELTRHIPKDGFLCWSSQNESAQKARVMKTSKETYRTLEFNIAPTKTYFRYESPLGAYSFRSPLSFLTPYTEAFGCAIACMEMIEKASLVRDDFFLGYKAPSDRFSQNTMVGGAVLISDIYKAVPQCSKYVLNFALTIPAKKRIAVVSAMHPLWSHESVYYQNLAEMLQQFDTVYFIGPQRIYFLMRSYAPRIMHINQSHFEELAKILKQESKPDTVIVIKTAGRYHIERMVTTLLA